MLNWESLEKCDQWVYLTLSKLTVTHVTKKELQKKGLFFQVTLVKCRVSVRLLSLCSRLMPSVLWKALSWCVTDVLPEETDTKAWWNNSVLNGPRSLLAHLDTKLRSRLVCGDSSLIVYPCSDAQISHFLLLQFWIGFVELRKQEILWKPLSGGCPVLTYWILEALFFTHIVWTTVIIPVHTL